MNIDSLVKSISFLFNRTTWLMLFWSNIIAFELYMVAVQEVQDLLSGNLSEYYFSILWKLVAVLLRVNNSIFNYLLIGFIIWGSIEIASRSWIVNIMQKILNSEVVRNIYFVCILAYIIIGNILTSFSFILIFFFQDLLLFQSMLSFEKEFFSLQHPASTLTWPAVAFGTWCAISSLSNRKNIIKDYSTEGN